MPEKEYIARCDCPEVQEMWEPTPGDRYFRKYTVFGEEVDKQFWSKDKRERIEILCYKPSSVAGYWVGTANDTSFVTTDKDLTKKTCIWLPTQEQLWEMLPFDKDIAYSINKRQMGKRAYFRGEILSGCEAGDYGLEDFEGDSAEEVLIQTVFYKVFSKRWEGKWVECGE